MKNSVKILIMVLLAFTSATAQIKIKGGVSQPIEHLTSNISAYKDLFNRIKNGECFNVKVSSVSTKNNNYAFVSYAQGFVEKYENDKLKISNLNMEFDDRTNFQGPKTNEEIVVTNNHNNVVSLYVKMITWGNRFLTLKNVKITKERFGYFITGNITDGNRTVYYTLGIYKTDCLI